MSLCRNGEYKKFPVPWKPEVKAYKPKFGDGTLLIKALVKSGVKATATLRDQYGLIAYETSRFILLAKKSGFYDEHAQENIVSVSEQVLSQAVWLNKGVVLYMANEDAFYWFDAAEVMRRTDFTNYRNKIKMRNFKLSVGCKLAFKSHITVGRGRQAGLKSDSLKSGLAADHGGVLK